MKTTPTTITNVFDDAAKAKEKMIENIRCLEKASVEYYFSTADEDIPCPFLEFSGVLLELLQKLDDRIASKDEWGLSELLADLEWTYQNNAPVLKKAKEVA